MGKGELSKEIKEVQFFSRYGYVNAKIINTQVSYRFLILGVFFCESFLGVNIFAGGGEGSFEQMVNKLYLDCL